VSCRLSRITCACRYCQGKPLLLQDAGLLLLLLEEEEEVEAGETTRRAVSAVSCDVQRRAARPPLNPSARELRILHSLPSRIIKLLIVIDLLLDKKRGAGVLGHDPLRSCGSRHPRILGEVSRCLKCASIRGVTLRKLVRPKSTQTLFKQ